MNHRKNIDLFAVSFMTLLCVCWGSQQVAIKGVVPFMDPLLQVGVRSSVAAFLVILFMRFSGQKFDWRDGTFSAGLLVGLLFAGEFLCASLALAYTSASHVSVFLYTGPVFTALGLHVFVRGERLSSIQWLGILSAFAGLALIFLTGKMQTNSGESSLFGDLLGVAAGLFWGITTVVIRSTALSEASASKTLLFQLSVTGLLALGACVVLGKWEFQSDPLLWASLAYQSIVIAFLSFLSWLWLLRKYLASRLSVFSFLTPLFGVSFGMVLLKETVTVPFLAGAALVLAGILIVNWKSGKAVAVEEVVA